MLRHGLALEPERPIDRAIAGGLDAAGLGAVFLAGYGAALSALVPGVPVRTSLCATEAGGAHPAAIVTRLTPELRVIGHKRWSTHGDAAELFLVVASVGTDDRGRNRLKLVRVSPRAPGVIVTPMPPTPFVPEIGHAEVALDTVVTAADVLPGDGYLDYVKPFRTIEDIHVHAAFLAWVLALAERHAWPEATGERVLASLVTLRALATMPPLAPATHLALAGTLALTRELIAGAPWDQLPADLFARWQRDRALLDVATRAREARRTAAWSALRGRV